MQRNKFEGRSKAVIPRSKAGRLGGFRRGSLTIRLNMPVVGTKKISV